MNPRYTLDGSPTLEAHLAATCDQVLAGVRQWVPASRLEGLLLGGGYGRGEGGVLRTSEGDRPYNDLEFYVFIRGQAVLAEREFRQPLHELGERLSPAAGLEVEFKVLTLDKLRASPVSMFYYDLVAGHRWQFGDDSMLAGCDHHRDASRIPLHEATRLLMNRCSGLLFSAERLARPEFGPDEADFVGRNLAKARLAFGDVLLTACGQYHWSCRERHGRLLQLPWEPGVHRVEGGITAEKIAHIRRHHASGVEFKLHPCRTEATREELARQHAELTALGGSLWLWLENRRLDLPFTTAADYAATPANLCPETSSLRNRLVNARASGLAGLLNPRYPRERLFRALNLLLWEASPLPAHRAELQRLLATEATDVAGLTAAYGRLWSRFN